MTFWEADLPASAKIQSMRRQRKKQRVKRPPPAITNQILQDAATQYLSRYVATAEQLRRVLVRKVDKTLRARGEGDRRQALALVEKEIERRIAGGYIEDQRVANAWTDHLHRQGKSKQQIRSRLLSKGVDSSVIATAIEALEEEHQYAGFLAAATYARKRGFGPFRTDAEQRRARKVKDVASMLRAGHSYDVVKDIFDCSDLDELELLIQERE